MLMAFLAWFSEFIMLPNKPWCCGWLFADWIAFMDAWQSGSKVPASGVAFETMTSFTTWSYCPPLDAAYYLCAAPPAATARMQAKATTLRILFTCMSSGVAVLHDRAKLIRVKD